MTHIVHITYVRVQTESVFDYDFCIFYDLIMQIASQTDATTTAQRKYPDICDSALHLFAAPTHSKILTYWISR